MKLTVYICLIICAYCNHQNDEKFDKTTRPSVSLLKLQHHLIKSQTSKLEVIRY